MPRPIGSGVAEFPPRPKNSMRKRLKRRATQQNALKLKCLVSIGARQIVFYNKLKLKTIYRIKFLLCSLLTEAKGIVLRRRISSGFLTLNSQDLNVKLSELRGSLNGVEYRTLVVWYL